MTHHFRTFTHGTQLTAVYPTCCTSAYCGGGGEDCKTCRHKPTLDAFNQWVKDHDAVIEDPIWSNNVYTARK